MDKSYLLLKFVADAVPACAAVPNYMRISRHENGISRHKMGISMHEVHNCMRRHISMQGAGL